MAKRIYVADDEKKYLLSDPEFSGKKRALR